MNQEHGSLQNLMLSGATTNKPEVGQGVTEICWTDRHAGTITSVSKSGKSFKWRQDIATRTDSNGMSDVQTYDFKPNPDSPEKTARQHKNGKFYTDGRVIQVGARSEYHDFSF